MAKQSKLIHLTTIDCCDCVATCNRYTTVVPIEAVIKKYTRSTVPKGTFDPTKVTCKRCLKHKDYKIAMDKIKYPLFHWKEN